MAWRDTVTEAATSWPTPRRIVIAALVGGAATNFVDSSFSAIWTGNLGRAWLSLVGLAVVVLVTFLFARWIERAVTTKAILGRATLANLACLPIRIAAAGSVSDSALLPDDQASLLPLAFGGVAVAAIMIGWDVFLFHRTLPFRAEPDAHDSLEETARATAAWLCVPAHIGWFSAGGPWPIATTLLLVVAAGGWIALYLRVRSRNKWLSQVRAGEGTGWRVDRWNDLQQLLRRRDELAAMPEEAARFRLELGRQMERRLNDTKSAFAEYEAVVGLEPVGASRDGAIEELERLMRTAAFRARAIAVLRPLYEAADDWRKIVVLNEEACAIAPTLGERVAILEKSAELWEARGKDLPRALECVRFAFALDPTDEDARTSMLRLASATDRWDDVARAYEEAVPRAEGARRREILEALARLHERRDEPRGALATWAKVAGLDETDAGPLVEMERLATALSDWRTLADALTRRAEITEDQDERAATWRRVGEVRRDRLDDEAGAVEAYDLALGIEPESAPTMDALIDLLEAGDDTLRLVVLYRRRLNVRGEVDAARRFELLCAAARRHAGGLGDRGAAIALYEEALTLAPASPDVVLRLCELYEAERRWPELLANLRQRSGEESETGARRDLTRRIATLLSDELGEPAQALEAHAELLSGGYDADAAMAVFQLAERCAPLRLDAVRILEPALRQDGRLVDLLLVLEMRCRAETTPEARAATLLATAEIHEEHRGDAPAALAALLRAMAETPHVEAIHDDIARLARRVGRDAFVSYAEALAEAAMSTGDAKTGAVVLRRLGLVARDELDDLRQAANAFNAAIERAGDAPDLLRALASVLEPIGDGRALASVLARLVAVAASPAEQADLLHRLATQQMDALGDNRAALATLSRAMEKVPGHAPSRETLERLLSDGAIFAEVFATLEPVYRSLRMAEGLAAIFDLAVRRAKTPEERAKARRALARVLEEEAGSAARAQRVVEAIPEEQPERHRPSRRTRRATTRPRAPTRDEVSRRRPGRSRRTRGPRAPRGRDARPRGRRGRARARDGERPSAPARTGRGRGPDEACRDLRPLGHLAQGRARRSRWRRGRVRPRPLARPGEPGGRPRHRGAPQIARS